MTDDDAWRRLVGALGWTDEPALATLAGRLAAREAIDARLAAWTREQPAETVAALLQAAGVSASVVEHGDDHRACPHLAARGGIVTVEHPEIGPERHAGNPLRLSRTPLAAPQPAPRLGADTETVLTRWLGLAPDDGGAARRRGRLPLTIRDRAAIVGIGQTPFGKALGRSEYDMAVEAILAACADAGISPREIDGIVRYDMETTDEEKLLAALGNPCLRYFVGSAWGGGGSASVLVLAATAIAAGMASTVLVYRSRARGKQSVYGHDRHQGGRYWERLGTELPGLNQWHVPHGLVSAFQEMAMIAMRHRIDYGTTDDQYADVAVAFRGHAVRNPNAVMRTPDDARRPPRLAADRRSAAPLRLQHRDRRRGCPDRHLARARARPAPAARDHPRRRHGGRRPSHPALDLLRARARATTGRPASRASSGRWAGVGPADVDAVFFYDFFTSFVIIALEDYGFAPRGEGGPFAADGGLAWPDGRLVCNTNGGQLSEAFIHGFNNTVEAVRQIRGTLDGAGGGLRARVRRRRQHRPDRRRDPAVRVPMADREAVLTRGAPLPQPTLDNAPFYEAARRGELRFQRCADCGASATTRARSVPHCLSREHTWERSTGRGTVYTWTIVRGPTLPAFEARLPYNVVDVLLDEGVHFVSEVLDCPPEAIRAGLPVEAMFVPVSDEITLVKFRRVGAHAMGDRGGG